MNFRARLYDLLASLPSSALSAKLLNIVMPMVVADIVDPAISVHRLFPCHELLVCVKDDLCAECEYGREWEDCGWDMMSIRPTRKLSQPRCCHETDDTHLVCFGALAERGGRVLGRRRRRG